MNNQFKSLPNEESFNFQTEHVMYTVMNFSDGINIPVHSREAGINMIQSLAKEGIMARLQTRALFYTKRIYAMDANGDWLYIYYHAWREVERL
jgi:hypothetical protein